MGYPITIHDNPAFPPHQVDDLVDRLALVHREWRRDNAVWCKEELEAILDVFPWSKEAADWYALVMSRIHHIYSPRAMVRLYEHKSQQSSSGSPPEITDVVARLQPLKHILRNWAATRRLRNRSVIRKPWARGVPQWATVVDIGGNYGEMGMHWLGTPGILKCVVVEVAMTSCLGGDKWYPDQRMRRVCATGDALPLRDNVAEVSVLSGILEHVLEPQRLIDEAERVLRPGGLVMVQVPYGGADSIPSPQSSQRSYNPHVRTVSVQELVNAHPDAVTYYVDYTGRRLYPHASLGHAGDWAVAWEVQ